jgi:transposase, IS605 orfB family
VFKDRSNLLSLTERHIISENHPFFRECDALCFLSKNLYNATLYEQRQSFFREDFENYYQVNARYTKENQFDYRNLPAKVSKQVQMLVNASFKSFFALVEKKEKGEYDAPVRLPKYLKKDGRQVINYEKGALSIKDFGDFRNIKLSKTNIIVKSAIPKGQITNVSIVPNGNHYIIEVVYDVVKPSITPSFSRVAFADPGMNNLLAVTSNVFNPVLYNGRQAKAVNQLYNKEIANALSKLPEEQTWSKRTSSITHKRNMRIHDMFHKITTDLVNYLVENDIDTFIMGHNVGQKQNINLGKKTNQNFVSIPFGKLRDMLTYKCARVGIHYVETEEAHTSKCSFTDRESIEHHDVYLGRRAKRGLFVDASGKGINADVNGSLNIGRKYMESVGIYTDELHEGLLRYRHNPKVRTVQV